jgi:hypothetical protein
MLMSQKSNTRPFGAPTTNRARRPQPQFRSVSEEMVRAAVWFIACQRIWGENKGETARLRKEFRESFGTWCLGSQMTSAAVVEIAWALAKADRSKFNMLKTEMDRVTAGEQTPIKSKKGKVLRVSNAQLRIIKTAGLCILLNCTEDQVTKANRESLIAGTLVGQGRAHVRATHELISRLFPAGMLEAYMAAFEAAAPQPAANDKVVELETPAPAQGDTSAEDVPASQAC